MVRCAERRKRSVCGVNSIILKKNKKSSAFFHPFFLKICFSLRKQKRWYDVDFFFIHAASRPKKFTGAIKRNNSLQFMLDFIEKTSDVRFEVKENVVRVYNR